MNTGPKINVDDVKKKPSAITRTIRVQLTKREEDKFEAMYVEELQSHYAELLKRGGAMKEEDFAPPSKQDFQNDLMRKALSL